MRESQLLTIAAGNFNAAIASDEVDCAKVLSDICINLNLTFKQSNTLRAMVGYMY
jgi:hypothetical protein